MDYEKAYNDLIARINEAKEKPSLCMKDKHHYNGYVETGIRDALDYIVNPESEDERIRTRLIALVEAFGQGKYKDEMLAYLERQKDERELGFIEGKVEGVRQTCQEIKDAMSLFEPKDLTPFEFTFRDYIDSAIRYCLSGEGYQQYIKEWAADLLNLEKQKEQKPAEWSEEDERLLTKLMTYVDIECFDRECNGQDIIDWLKSLRPQPHWKPSKEQIDALERAIIKMHTPDDIDILAELRDNLKKL